MAIIIILRTREVVDDFLRNVRSRFKPSGMKLIKSSFVIENIQQVMPENLRPIMNTRFWTTDAYKTRYFNDFYFIVNGVSGSS